MLARCSNCSDSERWLTFAISPGSVRSRTGCGLPAVYHAGRGWRLGETPTLGTKATRPPACRAATTGQGTRARRSAKEADLALVVIKAARLRSWCLIQADFSQDAAVFLGTSLRRGRSLSSGWSRPNAFIWVTKRAAGRSPSPTPGSSAGCLRQRALARRARSHRPSTPLTARRRVPGSGVSTWFDGSRNALEFAVWTCASVSWS